MSLHRAACQECPWAGPQRLRKVGAHADGQRHRLATGHQAKTHDTHADPEPYAPPVGDITSPGATVPTPGPRTDPRGRDAYRA